jgi:3-oxoadipate enol-lactonase
MTPVALSYVADGPDEGFPVLLGSSIGTTHAMWGPQIEALARRWRAVRFDARGHGGSPAPRGPYKVTELAADVIALADALGIESFAYCGVSLGGAIGLQLALEHPERVSSLVLCCTSSWFGGPDPWRQRAARVRAEGMDWLVEASRLRWFRVGQPLPDGGAELLEGIRLLDLEGYASCCDAIAVFDVRDQLGRINAPTRVIAGAEDVAAPAPMTDFLADRIPGADLVRVAGAAHIANVEQPGLVTKAIVEHLERTGSREGTDRVTSLEPLEGTGR